MSMFLKNYTSEVPSGTTIQRIVGILVKIGVAQIAMDYGLNGEIVGLTFAAHIEGRIVPIKLPVDVGACQEALWRDYVGSDRAYKTSDLKDELVSNGNKRKRRSQFRDQAERTAWKLMQDWIEVQISMVQLKQADVLQVFLPYAWDGGQSFYHRLKAGGFAALMAPKEGQR